MNDLKLKQCPFFGSENIQPSGRMDYYHNEDLWVIECNNCLAQGGASENKNQAIILWNIRSK